MMQKLLDFTQPFRPDALSAVLIALVAFVAVSIGSFSARYLKGDRKQAAFYADLVVLVLSVFVLVCADHILVLLAAWGLSNLLLTKLIAHKHQWEAARQSSILAAKNFLLGFVSLGAALMLLFAETGNPSIQAMLAQPPAYPTALIAGLLLVLAAMTQSALWPFHRWLTSSLNAPTPVSAIMHAGLVNGGGFLLARFAPLFASQPVLLNILFAAGIFTAVLGTLWKLMQHDIKRMLAHSTMGQMGFMVAQCGLGLFPAAVAHLCWHGLFKAYLFLSSGSAAKEKRLDLHYPPTAAQFVSALACGILAACTFALSSDKTMSADTNLFLCFLALLAGAQFALPILRGKQGARLPLAIAATAAMGAFYGLSVHLVENALAPLNLSLPQSLNILHLLAAVLLAGTWLVMLFRKPLAAGTGHPEWMLKQYVHLLNGSQPHPKTVTAHRNKYHF